MKTGPPICRRVVQTADLWALTEEEESPLTDERNERKLATSISLGLNGRTECAPHQESHELQCEA